MANGPKTKEGVNLYLKGLCFAVTVLGLVVGGGGGYLVINAISQSAAVARVETKLENTQKGVERIEAAVNEVRTTVLGIKASQDRADVDHGVIKTALKAEGKKAEAPKPSPAAFPGYYGFVLDNPTSLKNLGEIAPAIYKSSASGKEEFWIYTDDPKVADALKNVANPKKIYPPPK